VISGFGGADLVGGLGGFSWGAWVGGNRGTLVGGTVGGKIGALVGGVVGPGTGDLVGQTYLVGLFWLGFLVGSWVGFGRGALVGSWVGFGRGAFVGQKDGLEQSEGSRGAGFLILPWDEVSTVVDTSGWATDCATSSLVSTLATTGVTTSRRFLLADKILDSPDDCITIRVAHKMSNIDTPMIKIFFMIETDDEDFSIVTKTNQPYKTKKDKQGLH
jgi:hypothetical protein